MEMPTALTVLTNPTVHSVVRATNTCATPVNASLCAGNVTGGWIAPTDRMKISVEVNP